MIGIPTVRAATRPEITQPTKQVKTFQVLNLNQSIVYVQKRKTHTVLHSIVILMFIFKILLDNITLQLIFNLIISMDKQLHENGQDNSSLISQNHPYYELLKPIIDKRQEIFKIEVEPQQKVPQTDYKLKIYITQSEDQKLNNFYYTYTLPVSLQKFIALNEDCNLQKKLDFNLENYQIQKVVDERTKIMYISYKKVLFIPGRDFVYVRYNFSVGNQYWIISTSIPGQPEYPGITRGSIIMSAQKITKNENEQSIDIWICSKVNMKLQMKPEATKSKGVIQIKKYVQKCYEYLVGKM